MDFTSSNSISSLNALQTDAPTAGGQLAALEAQLKKLYKTETQVSGDSSLDAKTRKIVVEGLEAEIQMVTQRIADLKSGNKKGTTPITEAAVPTKIDKNKLQSELLNGTQPSSQRNKIDVTV